MRGIVGYIGKQEAKDILMEGLKRLEYRGYDSAGISLLVGGAIVTYKAVGKVSALQKKIPRKKMHSTVGIAHTRWATHGSPSFANAHPHRDCTGAISLVHNGIIENYQSLRAVLEKKKHHFLSETDSEVIVHLIEEEAKKKSFEKAVFFALRKLKGTYGIVVVNKNERNKMIAARSSSPLVLGIGDGEFVVASDASAVIGHTKRVVYLEDGEIAVITPERYHVITSENKIRSKKIETLEWTEEEAQKQGYPHFMLKEIFEEPHAIRDALRGRLLLSEGTARLGGLHNVNERIGAIKRIIIISCGTSYHAGLVGEYMLEEYAGIPVEVEYASEFRYRKTLLDAETAVVAISQSGETADTLAAVREAKRKGALTLGIVNTVGATIARETDAGVYNHAGPEIGVASTKAFVSQLSILALLTLLLGRQRSLSLIMGRRIASELSRMPQLVSLVLNSAKIYKKIARRYYRYNNFLYFGRKYNYPIALEGALKIKEVSYVHAEGYAAGEMKHGPIAMIDKNFPSVVIAPKDSVYDKALSGISEIKARGGKVIALTTEGNNDLAKIADDCIFIPKTLEMLSPLVTVVPLQLLAYYVGVYRGHDVDQPRNLAKSVTVE